MIKTRSPLEAGTGLAKVKRNAQRLMNETGMSEADAYRYAYEYGRNQSSRRFDYINHLGRTKRKGVAPRTRTTPLGHTQDFT